MHIKLLGDVPVGASRKTEARIAAGYLSKYVGKAFDDAKVPGLHRYEVAQGFQPISIKLRGHTLGEVVGQAVEVMGDAPAYVWQSQIAEGWQGPPAVWVQWR